MTTIAPEQRTAVGCYRRELEVILASAPAGAAVVVACTVLPAASGPPLHVHAASDETFLVLSGVLLVHTGGQVATIPEGGLVHVSHGMPHTFATRPGSPARFLVLLTPGGSGESCTAAAHAVQAHNGPLPRDDLIRLAYRGGRAAAPWCRRGYMRQALGRRARPFIELPPGRRFADVSAGRVPPPCLGGQLAGLGDELAGLIRADAALSRRGRS